MYKLTVIAIRKTKRGMVEIPYELFFDTKIEAEDHNRSFYLGSGIITKV